MHLAASFLAALVLAAGTTATAATKTLLIEEEEEPRLTGETEPPGSAAEVLDATLRLFPTQPLQLRGELLVRRQRGVLLRKVPFAIELEWGAPQPRAAYRLYDNFGRLQSGLNVIRLADGSQQLEWLDANASPMATPPAITDLITDTDIAWLDLTLAFLWWPDAALAGTETFRGALCDIITVTPPTPLPGCSAVRLWIDRRLRFMRQAEQLDETGASVRRIWVSSVGKLDNRWMIRNMEAERPNTGMRTKLHVEELDTLQ